MLLLLSTTSGQLTINLGKIFSHLTIISIDLVNDNSSSFAITAETIL
jgi:hypothetical protein